MSALILLVLSELIIISAIFLIAYPIERWLVKAEDSAAKSATRYLLLGLGSVAVNMVLVFTTIAQLTNLGWLPIYLFFGSAIGTFTAYLGRLIYPRVVLMVSKQ